MQKCPNCGYERQPKDKGIISASDCPRCGIIYNKFGKRQSLEEKKYKVKSSSLLFIKSLIAGFFILGGLLILWRNSAPGGVESMVIFSILSVVFGILLIFLYLQEKSYFVSLTEKGIKIANKQVIPWEDIYHAEWKNEVSYYKAIFPIRSQWIDVYISGEAKQKIRIAHRIENIEDLYHEIKKRVNSVNGIRIDSVNETKMLIKIGAGMISLVYGYSFMIASLFPGEKEELILTHDHPTLAFTIGIILFIAGILLIVSCRK